MTEGGADEPFRPELDLRGLLERHLIDELRRHRRDRAEVDPDPDWGLPLLRLGHYFPDILGLSNVTGVEAEAVDAGVKGLEGQRVLEVNIGDERDGRMGHDVGQGSRRLAIGDRDADDFAARVRKLADLGQGGDGVTGVSGGHRLDDDRVVATDLDVAHVKDARLAPGGNQGHSGHSFGGAARHQVGRCGEPRAGHAPGSGWARDVTQPGLTPGRTSRASELRQERLAINDAADVEKRDHEHETEQDNEAREMDQSFAFR